MDLGWLSLLLLHLNWVERHRDVDMNCLLLEELVQFADGRGDNFDGSRLAIFTTGVCTMGALSVVVKLTNLSANWVYWMTTSANTFWSQFLIFSPFLIIFAYLVMSEQLVRMLQVLAMLVALMKKSTVDGRAVLGGSQMRSAMIFGM